MLFLNPLLEAVLLKVSSGCQDSENFHLDAELWKLSSSSDIHCVLPPGLEILRRLLFLRSWGYHKTVQLLQTAFILSFLFVPEDVTKLDLNFVSDLWRGSTLKSLLQNTLRSFCSWVRNEARSKLCSSDLGRSCNKKFNPGDPSIILLLLRTQWN